MIVELPIFTPPFIDDDGALTQHQIGNLALETFHPLQVGAASCGISRAPTALQYAVHTEAESRRSDFFFSVLVPVG